MSFVLFLIEAALFVGAGALLTASSPLWLVGIGVLGFGCTVAVCRDFDTRREAVLALRIWRPTL